MKTKVGSRYTPQRRPLNSEELMAQRAVLGPGLGVLQHVNATHEELFTQQILLRRGKPVIGCRHRWKEIFNYILAAVTLIATITIASR